MTLCVLGWPTSSPAAYRVECVKILVIGGGGREHAICHALSLDESVTEACRCAAKLVNTVADCALPATEFKRAGASITVNIAALLLTLPAVFVTTTVNIAPLSLDEVGGVE